MHSKLFFGLVSIVAWFPCTVVVNSVHPQTIINTRTHCLIISYYIGVKSMQFFGVRPGPSEASEEWSGAAI